MIIKCDFHIHSCLSPCGDLAMSPSMIVSVLKQKGIGLAALTDHNCALNCEPFMELCARNGIMSLAGMEVQTIEEVHMLALFNNAETALLYGKELYAAMPDIPNNPEKYGDQVYVDTEENILGEVDKYLATSANVTIDDVVKRVHELGGLVIPAHVDRAAFSMTSQLGFIPAGNYDALETVRMNLAELPKECEVSGYAVTHSSDAHYIEHIARRYTQLDFGNELPIENNGRVKLELLKEALLKLRG
jgi:predicted metal-dependent phosphoesterase TrpH